MGDGRTLRATGSAGSFVTAWLLEPTVNSTCVLAVTAPWSVRVYVAARETHGRVCPLCYLLPVTCWVRPAFGFNIQEVIDLFDSWGWVVNVFDGLEEDDK